MATLKEIALQKRLPHEDLMVEGHDVYNIKGYTVDKTPEESYWPSSYSLSEEHRLVGNMTGKVPNRKRGRK